jgi:hypothetical protein
MPRALAQSTSPWSRPAAGCLRIPTGSRVGSSPSMPVWPLNSTLAGLPSVVPSQTGAQSQDAPPVARRQFAAGIFSESAWSRFSSLAAGSAPVVIGYWRDLSTS